MTKPTPSPTKMDVLAQQQQRLESILLSLKEDVLPKSAKMYETMAEGYRDELQAIRKHIDLELGLSPAEASVDAAYSISLEGQGIRLGDVSVAVINRYVEAFRRGLQSVMEMLESTKPPAARRKPRWIEKACDLRLAGVGEGSVKVYLAQPKDADFFETDERDSLRQATELLFGGVEWASGSSGSDSAFVRLDEPGRQAVLNIVNKLLPPTKGEIEAIGLGCRDKGSPGKGRQQKLTRSSRERVRKEIGRIVEDRRQRQVEGIVRCVDLDKQYFVLRERTDGPGELQCYFGAALASIVEMCLNMRAVVSGELVRTSKHSKTETMDVESLEILSVEEEPLPGNIDE
jgi:hypothetical protein